MTIGIDADTAQYLAETGQTIREATTMVNSDRLRNLTTDELRSSLEYHREWLSDEWRRELGLMSPRPSEVKVTQKIIDDLRAELARREVS